MTKGVKILILTLSSLSVVGVGVLVALLAIKSKYAFMDQTGMTSPVGGKTLIKSKKAITVGVYTVSPGNRMVIGKESQSANLLWQIINGGKYTEVTVTTDETGNVVVTEGESSSSKNGTITNNAGGTVVFSVGSSSNSENLDSVTLRKNKVYEFSTAIVVELGGTSYNLDASKAYQITYDEENGYTIKEL